MSQSEEPEEVPDTDKVGDNDNDDDFTIVTSIKNFCNFNNAKDNSVKSEPSTPMPLKMMKRRSFSLKIPRLSHLDFDTSRILISAYIALFRIQTDPEQSLSQCLRMFRELQTMSHVTAASLYETVNVIIERKIELDQLYLSQNEVDTAIQLVEKRLNDEQGEGVARFYLNRFYMPSTRRPMQRLTQYRRFHHSNWTTIQSLLHHLVQDTSETEEDEANVNGIAHVGGEGRKCSNQENRPSQNAGINLFFSSLDLSKLIKRPLTCSPADALHTMFRAMPSTCCMSYEALVQTLSLPAKIASAARPPIATTRWERRCSSD